jgi:hypothetical protein
MVSLAVALQRAENTMKNTIDDVDYIINMIIFIVIFQYFINSGHSNAAVSAHQLSKPRPETGIVFYNAHSDGSFGHWIPSPNGCRGRRATAC